MSVLRNLSLIVALGALSSTAGAQEPGDSNKPVLHGKHWVAITGKPLGATAGAMTFAKGGNAVDAACAMLAAVATMWDTLGWGGETQALIHDPRSGEVVAINALGAAPSGATPEFFRSRGMRQPPEYGPLAAVTPGTPGGLMVMLAHFGTMTLAEVLAPAIEMADGYPMEQVRAESIEESKSLLSRWEASSRVFLPHFDADAPYRWAAPLPGEAFRQPELLATLNKLVEAERNALEAGKTREEAIMAAYDRFYRGDIARDVVAGVQAAGGLFTMADLDGWQVYIEEPVSTRYKDIDVYKLTHWVQGPVMLQTLNILEGIDLKGMGYNSAPYIHALYQAMNLAFADRDFYYGDPYFPPAEPIAGLLSKEYARQRMDEIDWDRNDPSVRPGDPYPFQGESNPYSELLEQWRPRILNRRRAHVIDPIGNMTHDEAFLAGTTSIQAADEDGWVVSITPSGGWIPAFIAGTTGIGLSQRMQSFGLDESHNPFNLVEPGKRPRATLSPGMALSGGEPYMSFAVQGGDAQDQNLLQVLLNVVEFDMDVQQAVEAANINSYQMHSSFGTQRSEPGRLVVRADTPYRVIQKLERMGYAVEMWEKSSGPITAIYFDRQHGTMWGGASDYGDDYGIAW
ncbi:gamma-glutamyltransferase family protein [Candidatus Rariloculus sp.]|uniref:gamma-glutamyltransferase family protein n=1 Tax=Candidatus Rariloculus sp. TaxID=3101265 RepID=UPI003D117FA6